MKQPVQRTVSEASLKSGDLWQQPSVWDLYHRISLFPSTALLNALVSPSLCLPPISFFSHRLQIHTCLPCFIPVGLRQKVAEIVAFGLYFGFQTIQTRRGQQKLASLNVLVLRLFLSIQPPYKLQSRFIPWGRTQ